MSFRSTVTRVARPIIGSLMLLAAMSAPAHAAGGNMAAAPSGAEPAKATVAQATTAGTPAPTASPPAADSSSPPAVTAPGTAPNQAPASTAGAATAPTEAPATRAPGGGGLRSLNIFEVQRGADSSGPAAAAQAERQRTQPLNNAPVWREVNSGKAFYTSLPGRETGVLIQRGGEPWRQVRNGPVTQYGGLAVVLVILAMAAFHAWNGQIKLKEPNTGRVIERFTVYERLVHRVMSISFVTLAATGMLLLFGKYVLLPVFGYSFFSVLAAASKNIHNFVGPLFTVSLVLAFVVFVKDNLPHRSDIDWIRKFGGMVGHKHVSAHRFNAGEKMWFWGGVFALGIIVSISGFVLNFPNFEQTRGQMQLAWIVHAVGTLLFICMSVGHIYMGTIAMEGVREAMRTGYVDETWAKAHHDLWYEDVRNGKIPRVRSRRPDGPPDGQPVTTAP